MLLAAVMAEIQFRHGTFIDNAFFRHQLECMAEWLTADSAKFGILLCGKCGNGKSTMAKALQRLLNYLQIRDEYNNSTYGMPIVKTNDITELGQEEMNRRVNRLSQYPLLAIDDLGTEPRDVMHYGNVSSPIIRLIDKRYEEQLFTIITSNLTASEITEVYGERTGDRLAEMMQILPFDNPSYRRKDAETIANYSTATAKTTENAKEYGFMKKDAHHFCFEQV